MKNPLKMFNEKRGSCGAIFGETKVSSIESTERLLECGGGQKFFWMESWWSPVDRLGGGGENGDNVVEESLCGARSMVCSGEASLPPAAIRTNRPAVPQFNCTFVHI